MKTNLCGNKSCGSRFTLVTYAFAKVPLQELRVHSYVCFVTVFENVRLANCRTLTSGKDTLKINCPHECTL